ncbi:AzlD domain-containing protein [Adlercreutzia sp. ZJ138]|uniref:AzlD domain-containing protein n=1 Tax=Adlercreutzia sp. ZJ138 TaxID=2709405 RepID=UPI0013EBD231|nr:AzlD domain-containing protein [Adlercreutzia sp. ZJ138]
MEPMGWTQFFIVFACCSVTMIICRVAPLFLLKGRALPEHVERALGFIPPAAFAALVANDLLSPNMFDAGLWPAAIPLLAAAVVVVVAKRTHSLLWCGIAGVIAYALLMAIPL